MTVPACCCADWVAGLARDHARLLAAIARREGAAPIDALDLVQDAFHTLLARDDLAHVREQPDAAVPLLATIVRNAARNHRRRHYNARPHVALDDLASAEPNPVAALEHAADAARLGGCMAQLGDVHRHVITLRVLEELSGDETAQQLGLTSGHVAVLLHRARKQLERCMRTTGT
ncbi:MAG: sigma-70 family RNA polymerase sigma factor [Kofleriaceae bacterium]